MGNDQCDYCGEFMIPFQDEGTICMECRTPKLTLVKSKEDLRREKHPEKYAFDDPFVNDYSY